MSKNRQRTLSLPHTQNSEAPTENIMSTSQEPTPQEVTEKTPETPVPAETAKQMAVAEEENAARLVAQARAEQAKAEAANEEPISIIGLAAQGHAELHDAIRRHQNQKKPEYVPPPRTERQMSALQEELEAGRRTQQRAEAQLANRPIEKADLNKEGFTNPVYRPNDMVPDPMTGKLGAQRPTE